MHRLTRRVTNSWAKFRLRLRPPLSRRWLWVTVLCVLPAITLEITSTVASRRLHQMIETVGGPISAACLWLAIIGLCSLAFIKRITLKQIRRWHQYPPLWLTLSLSACLAAAIGPWSQNLLRWHQFDPYVADLATHGLYLAALMTTIIAIYRFRREPIPSNRNIHKTPINGLMWEDLRSWMSEDKHTSTGNQYDLFSHSIVAQSVSRYIQNGEKLIALFGEPGSGKTSIMDAIRIDLERTHHRFVMAVVDMNSRADMKDLRHVTLARIEDALSYHADTSMVHLASLIHGSDPLPSKFASIQRFARWLLGRLITPCGQISAILGTIDLHLVLAIENLDDATQSPDLENINGFLREFQETGNISLVLTGASMRLNTTLSKFSAVKEYIPSIKIKELAQLLLIAYTSWTTRHNDIDAHPSRDSHDKFELNMIRKYGIEDYLIVNTKAPLRSLSTVIRTPSALKLLLRHIDNVWEELHGEVELDDIIILTVLRYRADECFKFITDNIKSIRNENDDEEQANIKKQWQELLKAHPSRLAICRLAGLSGLPLLRDDWNRATNISPQGMHIHEPTDYFERIVAERLREGEITDQRVLQDIAKAEAGDMTSLVHSLNESLIADDRYHVIWRYFSSRHDDMRLLTLGKCVIIDLLTRCGPSSDGYHPVLIEIWRRRVEFLGIQEFVTTLIDIIRSAAPVSLSFINGFLHLLVLKNDFLMPDDKLNILRKAFEELCSVLRSYQELIRILSVNHPGSIDVFVTMQCEEVDDSSLETCAHIFARLMVDASEAEPDTILPQVARIALQRGNLPDAIQGTVIHVYSGQRERMVRFFGRHLPSILQRLAVAQCEDEFVREAKPYAQRWLDDLGTSGSD